MDMKVFYGKCRNTFVSTCYPYLSLTSGLINSLDELM